MSKKNKDEPEQDPYDVLGIQPGVSDSVITKAYRKLALKLHPDKQQGELSPSETERIAVEFHNVKNARAFLLEAEFREARIKYDAKRASIQRRRQAEKEREANMNDRRKRMREELKRKEDEARSSSNNKRSKTTSSSKSRRSSNKQDDELLEKLRREGSNLRQAHAEKEAQSAVETAQQQAKQEAHQRKERERLLENRQVRLKWSRKKMTTSPSEDSIATLLSRFGSVEHVEMLGSKGNLALVTFVDPSSCRSCVEAYRTSEEMRASYVGKRKEDEELKQAEEEDVTTSVAAPNLSTRHQESLYDRKLRQAAEREQLLRELEDNDDNQEPTQQFAAAAAANVSTKESTGSSSISVQFPSTEDYRNLSPMQKLEKAEADILEQIVPPDIMAQLKPVNVK